MVKKIFEYLYYEHGYWLFDYVLPIIGCILFFGVIAYLFLNFIDPITVKLIIQVEQVR